MMQNRCLRFILNLKLKDKARTAHLHEKLKIEPLNQRLNRLAKKMLYGAREKYTKNPALPDEAYYKLSDYYIQEMPIRKRKRPVAERINKYIYKKVGKKSILHSLPEEKKWRIPEAIY